MITKLEAMKKLKQLLLLEERRMKVLQDNQEDTTEQDNVIKGIELSIEAIASMREEE